MHERAEVVLVDDIFGHEFDGQAHVLIALKRYVEVEVLHVARHETGTYVRDGVILK